MCAGGGGSAYAGGSSGSNGSGASGGASAGADGGGGGGDGVQIGNGGSPGTASVKFSVYGSYCQSACGQAKLEIEDTNGQVLGSDVSACEPDCSACSAPFSCPPIACPPPGMLTDAGFDWDGSYYVSSTCGSGTSCRETLFAKPGTYIAKLCANPGALSGVVCVPSGPETCTSVEFDFPSNATVMATFGQATDGGAMDGG